MTGADVSVLAALGQLGPTALSLGALAVLWRLHLSAVARERQTTDLERQRADRAEAAKDELQVVMREQVIPVLTRSTDGLLRLTESTRDRRT